MNNGTIDNDSDGVESMEGGEGEVVVGISNVRGTSFNYLLKSGITMTCSLPRMHVGSIGTDIYDVHLCGRFHMGLMRSPYSVCCVHR